MKRLTIVSIVLLVLGLGFALASVWTTGTYLPDRLAGTAAFLGISGFIMLMCSEG